MDKTDPMSEMLERLAHETLAANVATQEFVDTRRELRAMKAERDRYRRALRKILSIAWGAKVKRIAIEALSHD